MRRGGQRLRQRGGSVKQAVVWRTTRADSSALGSTERGDRRHCRHLLKGCTAGRTIANLSRPILGSDSQSSAFPKAGYNRGWGRKPPIRERPLRDDDFMKRLLDETQVGAMGGGVSSRLPSRSYRASTLSAQRFSWPDRSSVRYHRGSNRILYCHGGIAWDIWRKGGAATRY